LGIGIHCNSGDDAGAGALQLPLLTCCRNGPAQQPAGMALLWLSCSLSQPAHPCCQGEGDEGQQAVEGVEEGVEVLVGHALEAGAVTAGIEPGAKHRTRKHDTYTERQQKALSAWAWSGNPCNRNRGA
jgi:hypothetical protein